MSSGAAVYLIGQLTFANATEPLSITLMIP